MKGVCVASETALPDAEPVEGGKKGVQPGRAGRRYIIWPRQSRSYYFGIPDLLAVLAAACRARIAHCLPSRT